MPNLYPQHSGYQPDDDFIGPRVPGVMRGKLSVTPLDALYDDSIVLPHDVYRERVYSVYESGTDTLIAANVTWHHACAIRSAQRLMFETSVDIFETSDEIPSGFSHEASDIYTKSPENDAPVPEPPVNDWKVAAKRAHAARMFVNKTVVTETRISGAIGAYKKYSPTSYNIIDVRTMQVLFSAENVAACKSYISQAIERRGNKVYHYRIIRGRDLLLYRARVNVLGYRMTYLGKTVVIGTEKDIREFFASHKEPNLLKMKLEKMA